MKRNINLYRPGGAGASVAWGARFMLGAWSAVAALALLAQLWLDHRGAGAARATDALKAEVATAQEQLNARMAATMAGADPQLEAQLNVVLRQLDLRETILGLLRGGSAGDTDGFSAQLRSLARQQAAGVWLTRVEVQAPASRTTLEGEALSPEFVPIYLRQLSGEPALAGQRFDRFHIERSEESGDTVYFALNRAEAAAESR